MNSKLAGLPPGLFEACHKKWKYARRVCQPAFTTAKLRKVGHTNFDYGVVCTHV